MWYSLASVQLILSFLYFPLSPQSHLWGKSSCENWSVCNLLKQKQNITASSKGLDITTFKDMRQNTHTKQLQHTRMMTAEEATGRRNVFASKNPWNCVMSKRTRVALGAKGKMVFTAFFFFTIFELFQAKPQLLLCNVIWEDFRQQRKFMTQVSYNWVTFPPSYCYTYIMHMLECKTEKENISSANFVADGTLPLSLWQMESTTAYSSVLREKLFLPISHRMDEVQNPFPWWINQS